MALRRLAPSILLAIACFASGRAEAQDECQTDEECVELYADGFTCADGTLGRYCVEPGCTGCWDEWEDWEEPSPPVECVTDVECEEARGAGWACSLDAAGAGTCLRHECDVDADCASHGPAWKCVEWGGTGKVCERDWEYVPPFRSCAAAPYRARTGDDVRFAALVAVVALALVATRRRD